jgi:hypothetical protein
MSKHNKSEKLSWDLWVASLLADMAPGEDGEEWIGDLKEARFKLVQDGKPNWYVVIITLLRTFELLSDSVSGSEIIRICQFTNGSTACIGHDCRECCAFM